MKVFEAVAAALAEEEIGAIFGLMGDGTLSLWAAIARDGRVPIVSARHEAAALAMADGFARASGRVGAAMVTCGPGLTQVGTSLVIAARHRSPLVLITGEIPLSAKNHTQLMDQRRFAEACEARFATITSPDNLAEEIAEAFYAARLHRRPVVLSLPNDLQERSFDWDFSYRPSSEFLRHVAEPPGEAALVPLADALAGAERPVIIAGKGAHASGAHEAIIRLAERIGALLATSLQAKGLFAGHPFDVGIAGAFASQPSERLLAEADFVLGVGAELGYYTTEGGLLFPSAAVARIDAKPAPEEIGVLPGLYVRGDAKEAVTMLNAMLEARQVRRQGFHTAETRAILDASGETFALPSDGLDPRALATALSEALPKDALITCGAGHFFSFPAMYLALPEGAEIRFSYHFGAVGQGLPLAIGIGCARPDRPHIVIEGDGSLMMHLQELETVVRIGQRMALIVWNDSGFGAEVHKLHAKGFDPSLAQWKSPDFAALARAFGGEGVQLARVSDIGAAVSAALARGGLTVIDARVSPTTLSDPYAKIHFGRANRAPLLRPLSRG
ncbi:MAG: thiamine pyrophosphate-binding protein [Rhodospirillales bacterium]|nr:thiamine pyrophosphate-binding protein [Rhodospirillales bacterium]